jgi:hypothetical protein
MSAVCKCCPPGYVTCDFLKTFDHARPRQAPPRFKELPPAVFGKMYDIRWSKRACCEAMRRVDADPGDATTLVGWNCPEHGLILFEKPLQKSDPVPDAVALELHQVKVRLQSVSQDRDYCAKQMDLLGKERDALKATLEYIRDTAQNPKLIAAAMLEKLARNGT